MTGEELQEKLLYKKKNGYYELNEKDEMFSFCDDYKNFLNACKTERECVEYTVKLAEENGFLNLENVTELKAGDKVYAVNREKAVMLAVIGSNPVWCGTKIVAAHIDSPRLDLKQNPVFESSEIAYFKTHYYGGIKKYQWASIPLAIHGVVIKEGGETVKISIGEKESDPVFYISDLLPHLAASQMKGDATKIIEGEKLNVILGTIPFEDDKISDGVKLNVLKLLNEEYGITEKDFVSAEIEIVPAYPAKDVGFDRSLIGAYGQDDRVCAYTALKAILDAKTAELTNICYLVDKEEVGSSDTTGMRSRFFEDTLALLCAKSGADYNDIKVRSAMTNSICLSSDVTAALDPNFESVMERNNSAYLNKGVCFMKYTGARGKSGTSDCSCEFVRKVTDIMDNAGVVWQTGELGKVDEGGGGTVAQYLAVLNIQVIDCGVPLLGMHSPYEISAKFDVYQAYKAYVAFYN